MGAGALSAAAATADAVFARAFTYNPAAIVWNEPTTKSSAAGEKSQRAWPAWVFPREVVVALLEETRAERRRAAEEAMERRRGRAVVAAAARERSRSRSASGDSEEAPPAEADAAGDDDDGDDGEVAAADETPVQALLIKHAEDVESGAVILLEDVIVTRNDATARGGSGFSVAQSELSKGRAATFAQALGWRAHSTSYVLPAELLPVDMRAALGYALQLPSSDWTVAAAKKNLPLEPVTDGALREFLRLQLGDLLTKTINRDRGEQCRDFLALSAKKPGGRLQFNCGKGAGIV